LLFERLDKRNAGLYALFVDEKFYGQAIRRRRDKARMTQRQLAKGAGIAPNTLSALENRGQGMRSELFLLLCQLVEADPREVADQAYYEFRKSLGAAADKRLQLREADDAARSAIPPVEEILELYDAAEATRRSLFLAVLRFMRPDKAVSAFLEDRFHELEPESDPPRTRPGPRRRPRRSG